MDSSRASSHVVRAGHLALLMQTLVHNHLDPDAIYGPGAMADLLRLDPGAYRRLEEWERMATLADAHVRSVDDIALLMADFIKPWDTGPIGFITMACRNLGEANMELEQFYSLLNDVYKMRTHIENNRFVI